ncbi:hypothetical protein HY949_04790 [Candidatus Gottesmanbacteria bacterium]|nr:hypothetical protein [Candidatus Gottesmanbacteria bacterium]
MRLFSISILFYLLASLPISIVAALEKNSGITIAPPSVQYDLAFPGMLPDNPFYKVKVLRDRYIADFISDPIKKIEFYLKQTDKGILAAAMLVDKNNVTLARETALKAEHNMTLLTYELYRLKGKQDEAFFMRLKTASAKHQEVLRSLMGRVGEADRQVFEQVIGFSKQNVQTIEEYQARPENHTANSS